MSEKVAEVSEKEVSEETKKAPKKESTKAGSNGASSYEADQIRVLEGLEAVRMRPGMPSAARSRTRRVVATSAS